MRQLITYAMPLPDTSPSLPPVTPLLSYAAERRHEITLLIIFTAEEARRSMPRYELPPLLP